MKFLVDAHLPPSLAALLEAHGLDALHTGSLPAKNKTRDGEINELSLRDERVVITKDTDFFYTHILQGRPWKLLLVRTGNIGTRELKAIFTRNLPAILAALQTHTLVELDRNTVTPVR